MPATTTTAEPGPDDAADWTWVLPRHSPTPAQALPRIAAICQAYADPFMAVLAVLETHPGLPKEVLAMAIRQFRPDLCDLSREDVISLMVAIINGAHQGLDAVSRSRRKADRQAAAAMWMGKDD